jgi:hypothetical protein
MEGFISVRFDFVVAGAFLPGHPDTVLSFPRQTCHSWA